MIIKLKLKYKPTTVQNARKKMCIIVTAGNVILGFLMSDLLSIRDGSRDWKRKLNKCIISLYN